MTFGRELVDLHTTPSMFARFQCMPVVSMEVRMKNILYGFIEGQSFWHAKRC